MQTDILDLLTKYDVPTPRYTSYPTVPFWNFQSLSLEDWKTSVINTYKKENGEICLYIHLPFCEELCTYCACNKRITTNHTVEAPYLESVLKEWKMYLQLFNSKPKIREIHLGGGTPTFFSPEHLTQLITSITTDAIVVDDHEFSVEVHPNYTTREHLEALEKVGFNRISLGVQDFDPAVQFIINRIQSFEKTKEVIDWARELGYFSVNIDLIYGLPKQTTDSIKNTIDRVKELMPDRIAFYSYAHVPWKSKGQRRYSDEDVPKAKEKLAMYNIGRDKLMSLGFVSIGMDHFALPTDKLMIAYSNGEMHRNFMGYTTTNHKLVVGLGTSSISDTWTAFAQNEKTVEEYQQKIEAGEWPIINGHLLSKKDTVIRKYILELMCKDHVMIDPVDFSTEQYNFAMNKLKAYAQDGLIELSENKIVVTPKGKLFIRNISSSLDEYLFNNQTTGNMFSKAI